MFEISRTGGKGMNQRIRELMKQSGLQPYYDSQQGDIEKFAELIVGECLKIAKNREDEFESAGLIEQSNAVGNVAYRISRQFGVKR
jgi:hypothetical protein